MRKILLIVPSKQNGGGINIVAYEIKKIFEQHLANVEVLFLKGNDISVLPNSDEYYLVSENGSFFFKLCKRLTLKRKLRKFNKDYGRYDLVLTFGFLPSILAMRVLKKNVIITQHAALTQSFHNPILKKYYFHQIKKLYPKAKKVVTISTDMENDLKSIVSLDNQKNLYNPLDFSKIKGKAQDSLIIPSDEKYFVYVGRLSAEKRIEELIYAFSNYLKSNKLTSITKLKIVGNGLEIKKLKFIVHKLNLLSNVEFTGNLANPYPLIAKAEALFLISQVEGFPNVLLEAITLETPVVSVDILSGPYEIILDKMRRTKIDYPMITQNGILLENNASNVLIEDVSKAMLIIEQNLFSPSISIIDREKIINEYLGFLY
ncbi:MAG: glycosyltransferase [Leuconostoc gelidum]|jgi:glycosyltransferase involved in cell wall biosynthesis|uniref:glycosyltransferase n=1 Tax=Leuconostoc gelidum TaxID=1244 RepID=UPI002F351388